jgi:hypothetical protein
MARDSAGQTTRDDSIAPSSRSCARCPRAGAPRVRADWFVNAAFLVGNQWVAFDGNQLFEPELEDWRAKLVDNRILPSQRREIARMTKAKPVWVGVPRDQSDRELAAARLRERVFEHYWRELKAGASCARRCAGRHVCGAGFWKICWDDTKGKGDRGPRRRRDGKPHVDEYGRPITPDDLEQLPGTCARSSSRGTSKHAAHGRRLARGALAVPDLPRPARRRGRASTRPSG